MFILEPDPGKQVLSRNNIPLQHENFSLYFAKHLLQVSSSIPEMFTIYFIYNSSFIKNLSFHYNDKIVNHDTDNVGHCAPPNTIILLLIYYGACKYSFDILCIILLKT